MVSLPGSAIATYLLHGGTSLPIRHDAGPVAEGRTELTFSGASDGRIFVGRAYSWGGNVFVLSAGYHAGEYNAKANAERDLAQVVDSLTFQPA